MSTIIYAVMVACTIAFNTWFGAFLGTVVKNHGWDNAIVEMITKVIVMTVPTIWTYPLNRFVIHRKKREAHNDNEFDSNNTTYQTEIGVVEVPQV